MADTQAEANEQAATDSHSPRVIITSLTFAGGDTIELPTNGLLVIVGPNNVGKSASLRNIRQDVSRPTRAKVICKPTFRKVGKTSNLRHQLAAFASRQDPEIFEGPEFSVHLGRLDIVWQENEPLDNFAGYFVKLLNTESRLARSGSGDSHAVGVEPPRTALQLLYENLDLQEELSDQFREVFDVGLVINPLGGSMIQVHVGNRLALNFDKGTISQDFVRTVRTLPLLDEQGDGMKSFASILMGLKVLPRSIVLIDEPEAFLHPPQERRVGKLIVDNQASCSQIIVSTHSENVIQGMLSGNAKRVSVVRLTRSGDTNRATILANDKIEELWKSPILRYSNILSGLFHEGVVIAESDGDCRFFEAVQVSLADPHRKLDLFYTHCGGKDRMPVLVSALVELNVPVRVVADVDILRDEELLKKIVICLKGDWSLIVKHWLAVKKAIEERKNWFRASDLKAKITEVPDQLGAEEVVSKAILNEISHLCRQTSPWDEIKRNGIPGPLAGEAAAKAVQLLRSLEAVGLFVLPVGELERFVKTVGGHGPKWVESALSRDLANDPELSEARSFVVRLIRSFCPD